MVVYEVTVRHQRQSLLVKRPEFGGGRDSVCDMEVYVGGACCRAPPVIRLLVSAYVSIRQLTSAYVSIRQHASAYVSMRQHTLAYVSIRQHTSACVSIHQHTSAYVSMRQHTSAGVQTYAVVEHHL